MSNHNTNVIIEAFGEDCNLYEILGCSSTTKAGLRKAYYRKALKFHPDKNPGNTQAALQFQAITAAYQILQDPEQRAAYDETGEIRMPDDDDDDDYSSTNVWTAYFDRIFGRITTSGIDAFAQKYKCSDEEKRDVLKEFVQRKGNLVKMQEFVMLSEPRDAPRWVEDYLRPAMDNGEVTDDYASAMEKSLKILEKRMEKEEEARPDDVDNDATESEDESPSKKRQAKASSKVVKKTKKLKKSDDMSDLIAQIQNKRGRKAPNPFDCDDDPLADEEAFQKAQAKILKKRR